MTTLTLSPAGLDVSLSLSREDSPGVELLLEAAVQPEITLDLTAGLPAASPDLEPVLDAIAALSTPDFSLVLNAIASIPAPAPTDLTPTLEAIAAIPGPDVAGKLAMYGTAKEAHVSAAVATLQAAIDAMPVPDVTGSLEAYDAAKASHLANTLATLQEAIAGVAKTAHLDEVSETLAKAADLAALVATAGTLATKTELASVEAAVLAAIAAIPPAVTPNQVIDVSLDAAGSAPAGYEIVNGLPSVPLGGLHTYFGKGQNAPTVGTSTSIPVPHLDGNVYWTTGASVHRWNKHDGFTSAAMAAVPGVNVSQANVALLPSGRLLVTGIASNSAAVATCWAGDLSSGTWNPVKAMLGPRLGMSFTELKSGRVAAVGGSTLFSATAASMTDRLEIFDESSNQWLVAAPAPVRGHGPSVPLPDGRLLWAPIRVSDGTTISTNLTRVFIFDPQAPYESAWSETDALPAGVVLSVTSVLAADDAGALLLDGGSFNACRYTAGNTPGARWSILEFQCPPAVQSSYRGGLGAKLRDGTIFMPRSVSNPYVVAVQYNPGNQIVRARKL